MSINSTNQVKEHYQNLLSKYYSWLFGDFDTIIQKNYNFFLSQQIIPVTTMVAVDLGSGSGFQSIPLAKLGFSVKSIDFDLFLQNELRSKIGSEILNIEILNDNILDFKVWAELNPELIVCMGDTLTHLPDIESVNDLIIQSYNELINNGKLIVNYRDLTNELNDKDRFILVKADKNRIFNCFLEYFPDFVTVYDIINEWDGTRWTQKISHYEKIKIPADLLKSILLSTGFEIIQLNEEKGFITFICEKI